MEYFIVDKGVMWNTILEILERGKGNPYIMYPRVTEQSEKIIELEKIDEIF